LSNKIGILNGILLIILNFFAVLPLGIVLLMGLNSLSGIPMNLLQNGSVLMYTWGYNDSLTTYSWLQMGSAGLISFFAIQIPLLVGNIIIFIASVSTAEKSRTAHLIALILLLISPIVAIIDSILGGVHTGTGPISGADLLGSFGPGFYMLVICIILQIFVVKAQNKAKVSTA
jgi:hypothetical protein